MTTLQDKRTDWLYEHFQAITRASTRTLALIGILFACCLAVWQATTTPVEFPFLKIAVSRELLLGGLLVSEVFLFVVFFGTYDAGERALDALAEELHCEWSDMWFVDTQPTLLDLAKSAHPERVAKRRYPARFAVALLYPLVLCSALASVTLLLVAEIWLRTMSWMEAIPFILALPVCWVAWHRASEYLRRRWWFFQSSEAKRRAPPAT